VRDKDLATGSATAMISGAMATAFASSKSLQARKACKTSSSLGCSFFTERVMAGSRQLLDWEKKRWRSGTAANI